MFNTRLLVALTDSTPCTDSTPFQSHDTIIDIITRLGHALLFLRSVIREWARTRS